jgi:DNA repair exonuclease SbcCD ATPase subunit
MDMAEPAMEQTQTKDLIREALAEGFAEVDKVRHQEHAGDGLYEDMAHQLRTMKADLERLQALEREWAWKQENEGVMEREHAVALAELEAKIGKLERDKAAQSTTNELLIQQTQQLQQEMEDKEEQHARARREWEFEREKDAKRQDEQINLLGQVELLKKQLDEAKTEVDARDKEIETLKRQAPDRQNEGKPAKSQKSVAWPMDSEADESQLDAPEPEPQSEPETEPVDIRAAFKNKLDGLMRQGGPRPAIQRSTTGTREISELQLKLSDKHSRFYDGDGI